MAIFYMQKMHVENLQLNISNLLCKTTRHQICLFQQINRTM